MKEMNHKAWVDLNTYSSKYDKETIQSSILKVYEI